MRQKLDDPAFEIDGRKGWQYAASAKAYLEYRSGRAWRPASHRFHPEHEYFTSGINLLNQLENSFPKTCACVYCAGKGVFADAKKPVAHAKAATAVNRNRA